MSAGSRSGSRKASRSGSRKASLLPSGSRSRSRRDATAGWLMVSPSAVLIGVFGLLPVVWSVLISFQRNDLQTPSQWVGLHNYDTLVHDPRFWSSVRHTVVYTALFVPITLVLSLLAAGLLNRRLRGMSVYRLAVFIPVVTSSIATGVIFTWLMDPDFGLINVGLHKLGLPTFQFFASPSQALPAIVIMTVWGWVGFGALIFLAGLQGIPGDLIDAAKVDGCSTRQAFWRIEVPLLRPVSAFLLVWLTINALQLFDEVYATTKGGPVAATTVVVYYLYQQAFQYFHAGYAAAIAVVLFIAIAGITLVQLRLTRDESTPHSVEADDGQSTAVGAMAESR